VLDLAPLIAEKPTPSSLAVVRRSRVRPCRLQLPDCEEVSLARSSRLRLGPDAIQPSPLRRELPCRTRPAGGARRAVRRARPRQLSRSRLYDARSGAVRLNGIDVRDATFASLRESIGVVTQDAHLFHETIRANLLYAKPDATEEELHEAVSGAQILPFIESLPDGLDTVVGDRGYGSPVARNSA